MRIGILGSGLMGAKLGTIFARAGHDVVFSYSRREITRLVESGAIKPLVDKVFPLEHVRDALAYSESGRATGKVVIKKTEAEKPERPRKSGRA